MIERVCQCGRTFSRKNPKILSCSPRCGYERRKADGREDQFEIRGADLVIKLPTGQDAFCDASDAALVMQYRWNLCTNRIARGAYVKARTYGTDRKGVYLHRLIIGITASQIHVDHIDADPLNNRRANLRTCTLAQNKQAMRAQRNSATGYKGVTPVRGRFRAVLKTKGKNHHLGYHDTVEQAAAAYNVAAREHYGQFAYQNPL